MRHFAWWVCGVCVAQQQQPSRRHGRGRESDRVEHKEELVEGLSWVSELVGGGENARALEALWRRDPSLGEAAREMRQRAFNGSAGAVRDPLEALWIRLTRLLGATQRLPFRSARQRGKAGKRLGAEFWRPGCLEGACLEGPRITLAREIFNRFNAESGALVPLGAKCAETGNGHFVREWSRCGSWISLDAFDASADVALDLDADPASAPPDVKRHHGSVDFLASHQVFEHLSRPSRGVANVNALLRVGGRLVFSTPFLLLDQPSPRDYFRYTTAAVERLLECGGFGELDVRGAGDVVSSLGLLVGVTPGELSPEELRHTCRGADCGMRHYIQVLATATKEREIGASAVADCFG